MKVLTVRHPWIDAILTGRKPVENRSWSTTYRGLLLLHAAAKIPAALFDKTVRLVYPDRSPMPAGESLRGGVILGAVQLVDVLPADAWKAKAKKKAVWAGTGFCWVLAHPVVFKTPLPCKGQLGLWTLPAALEKTVHSLLPPGR